MLKKGDEFPIFVKWMEFLKWLFATTEKFPKRVRFTFSNCIDQYALDIIEDLVEARYSTQKISILKRANLRLEKIRVLIRLCNQLRFLSHDRYEYAVTEINNFGRMLGGWIRQQEVTD